jgi:hypothetical protein
MMEDWNGGMRHGNGFRHSQRERGYLRSGAVRTPSPTFQGDELKVEIVRSSSNWLEVGRDEFIPPVGANYRQ